MHRVLVFCFLACFFIQTAPSFAQLAPASDGRYLLRTQNAPGVRQNYTLTETTTVVRTGKDMQPMEYRREVVYYFSQHANEEPQKGFTKLEVIVDSMTYRMVRAGDVWTYNSQDVTADQALSLPDIEASSALLNRPFTVTLSPYGEIVKTESEEIDWLKNYVVVEGRTMLDTLKKFVWLDGISGPVINNIADVRLNLLPFTFITPDSTWKRSVSFRAADISFSDTAAVSVTKVDEDNYILSAHADSLRAVQQITHKFDRQDFVSVTGGTGKATASLTVSRFGTVHNAEWTLEADAQLKEGTQEFHEKLRKVYSLTLTGQYRW